MQKIEGLRKLFGATLIKCSYYSLTLQTLVSVGLDAFSLQNTEKSVNQVVISKETQPVNQVGQTLSLFRRMMEELNMKVAEDVPDLASQALRLGKKPRAQ